MARWMRIARMGLWLGATVFGGVTAAHAHIRERAEELGLTPAEVDGLYALAVVLPGPSFLNLWGAVCLRSGGFPGAILGQCALLLPALLLVLGLPLLGALDWVGARAGGAAQAAIWATAGLLAATGIEGWRRTRSRRWLAAGALVALILGVHPLLVLAVVLGVGAV